MTEPLILTADSEAAARQQAAAALMVSPREIELQAQVTPRRGWLGIGRRPGRYLARKRAIVARAEYRIADALAVGARLDGDFTIEYADGNAVLTVNPPGPQGRAVTRAEVAARVQALQVEAAVVNWPAVETAVRQADSRPAAIAAWPAGAGTDAYFKLTVAADRLAAHLQVVPPRHGGKQVTLDEILTALHKQGITHGLRPDNIRAYLELGDFSAPVLVAAGTPPRDGSDALVHYHFRVAPHLELKEDDHGRVDYKELGLIQSVVAGALLAEKVPATPGVHGTDVHGRSLWAKDGAEAELKAGKNTALTPDGLSLQATRDGGVALVRDTVNVELLHRLDGDVSLATGNIDFAGTVEILGRVPDGFRVRAQGDLVVRGTVEAAFLEAGGNIAVGGGVLGRGTGWLKAGGDIAVKFAENADLQAGGSIAASELIMHSQTVCAGRLVLRGRRGALIGGRHVAGEVVAGKELGAPGGTRTVIQAGVPPKLLHEFARVQDRHHGLRAGLGKLELALQTIARAREEQTMTPALEAQERELVAVRARLQQQLAGLQHEEEQLQRAADCRPGAAVHAQEKAWTGVIIVIGAARLVLTHDVTFATFRNRDGAIAVTPCEGLPGEPPKAGKKK